MRKQKHAHRHRHSRSYRAFTRALEPLESRTLLSTYTVTNANDSGAGSLRQAILDANAHAGADTVVFKIGSGAKTINLAKGLPALGDKLTLDASTQPGYAGKPLITLNGAGAGSATDGLKIAGSGVAVRGLAINRFGGSGILVLGKGSNRITNCYVGTDSTGSFASANGAHGVLLQSPNNLVGGARAADRNVISGNGLSGVFVYTAAASGNVISGNFIGTSASGTAKIPNARNGVQIDGAAMNRIGGLKAGERNVISGNARDGVLIVNAGAQLNVVQGNFIGTNAAGTGALGNGWYGVEISRPDNVVGGAATGAGNVVSANGYGGIVLFLATASGNRVQGNFVGTDATGTKDLGNIGRGVEFTNGAHDNRVGGARFVERNVISGNDNGGVGFYSGSKMNLLQGNFIGTNAAGTAALGNSKVGVTVTDSAGTNFIGGPNAGNVISGNAQGIVLSAGTAPSIVQGNKVGTDWTGTRKIGNAGDGVYVGSSANQIGGKKRGTGNIISGNGGDGLRIQNSKGNLVRRNIVGADASGLKALGNAKNGVLLVNTNATPVRGNTVAFNGGHGVQVASGVDNPVVSNSVHSNAGLEINLGWDAASKNDSSDGDTGANHLQNHPTLTSAKRTSTGTTITGTITSRPKTTLYVEIFSGGGATFVGSVSVTTNASGFATFTFAAGKLPLGTQLVTTATSPSGSTSEYSPTLTVK